MYMHVALTSFSIVLCLEQRGGGIHVHACGVNLVFNWSCVWNSGEDGIHVHACGVRRFQLSCVWNSREEVCMYMHVA